MSAPGLADGRAKCEQGPSSRAHWFDRVEGRVDRFRISARSIFSPVHLSFKYFPPPSLQSAMLSFLACKFVGSSLALPAVACCSFTADTSLRDVSPTSSA